MAKVITGASMSMDGFIAGPGESGFEYLFDWYNNGDRKMDSASQAPGAKELAQAF